MDSNEQTIMMEQDDVYELNELPYFRCGEDDVPAFRERKQTKVLEQIAIEQVEVENDGIDRISDMPDNVLNKILCLMPTKNAMAAKILSTRWGSLFPFTWIPPIIIDLDDTLRVNDIRHVPRERRTKGKTKPNTITPTTDPYNHFKKFADETLDNLPCLDVLNLKCHCYVDEQKLSWVRAALRLNVRELSLQLYLLEPIELFHVLNGYTGLTRLEFCGGSALEFPNGFTLPNLKTLVLDDLNFWQGDDCSLPNLRTLLLSKIEIYSSPMNRLINNCLALEVLSFKRCYLKSYDDNSHFSFSIKCPSLKNLTIEDCSGIWECSLAIDSPNLQVLLFKGLAAEIYDIPNPFSSLLSAHIDVEFSYSADGVEELVAACSSAVDLYLCAYVIVALTRVQLPVFINLNRLALGHIQSDGWVMLAHLLNKSPNLEKLTFEQGFCLHDGGFSSFKSLMKTNPPCLEIHIKEIEFLVFDEREDEIKLVEYFMNNGKVIETLKLHCLPFKYKSTQERLAVFPRQSKIAFQHR